MAMTIMYVCQPFDHCPGSWQYWSHNVMQPTRLSSTPCCPVSATHFIQPTMLSSTRCSQASVHHLSQPDAARGRVLSQSELSNLLDDEEDAFFASRSPYQSEAEDEMPMDAAAVVDDADEAADSIDAKGAEPTVKTCDSGERTTIIVRNIACRLSTEAVRGLLHDLGFEGCYDFFYLPFCRSGNANAGYFFLNMKKASDVDRCKEVLQGQPLGRSQKLCDIVPARWQGLEALREQFSKKAVMKACGGKAPMFL